MTPREIIKNDKTNRELEIKCSHVAVMTLFQSADTEGDSEMETETQLKSMIYSSRYILYG